MPKINKKIIIGIAVAAVLFFGLVISWVFLQKERAAEEEIILELEEETIIERQLRELGELGEGVVPLTEEEVKEQLEEPNELPFQKEKTLSEEEIQRQLEELMD